jgi:transcription elongation factor Elf1
MKTLEHCPHCGSKNIATDPPYMKEDESMRLEGMVCITVMQYLICGNCGFDDDYQVREVEEDLYISLN